MDIPEPPTPSTNSTNSSTESEQDTDVIEPGDGGFDIESEGEVQEIDPPAPSRKKSAKSEQDEADFSATSMMDRVKNKASKASSAVGERAKRVQHRSASKDAEKASRFVERWTSEITATIKGALQTTTAVLVGGTYGTVSGAAKGTMPVHAKLLKQSGKLHMAGQWSRFQKGIETEEGLVDVFNVEFNEATAQILGLDESSGSYPVHSDAVTTSIEDPAGTGEDVQAIASPVYERESDRLIGVLAFVGEGEYEGAILVSLEEASQ